MNCNRSSSFGTNGDGGEGLQGDILTLRVFYAIFVVSENVTESRIKMYGEWLEDVDSFKIKSVMCDLFHSLLFSLTVQNLLGMSLSIFIKNQLQIQLISLTALAVWFV